MRAAVLLVLAAAAALVETAAGREAKRARQICVPDAAGTGWVCGPEHDPPEPPPAAPPPRPRAAPPPPPFLADPRRRFEGSAPLRPAETGTMASAAPPPAASPPSSAAPVAGREAPPPTSYATPSATAEPPPTAPAMEASPAAPRAATEERTPGQAAALPPPPPGQDEPARGTDFLALPPEAWAIQLAAGAGEALRVPEGLPAERAYLVPLAGAAQVLVLAPYRSLEEARAEASALSARMGRPVWPRRIGPLQSEARRVAAPGEGR